MEPPKHYNSLSFSRHALSNVEDFQEDDWKMEIPHEGLFAPSAGGVYAIIKSELSTFGAIKDEVLYIGQATNLKNRLRSHSVLKTCRKLFSNIRVFYKTKYTLRSKLERTLIRKFRPRLNSLLYDSYELMHKTGHE